MKRSIFSRKIYTVLVVPEGSSQVKRLTVPDRWRQYAYLALAGFVMVSLIMTVHYLHMFQEASENDSLKNENFALKARLRTLQQDVDRIDRSLQRINQLSSKVGAITQLNDPERNLAIGPVSDTNLGEVLYAPGERIDYDSELVDSKAAMRLIESRVDDAEGRSLREEQSMRELHNFFADEPGLLASMPSVRPIKSKLLTSTFGERTDPYTNRRVMHKGIDFAADHGSDVMAPADGVVIFAAARGAYGKTLVVDHGYGIQTHFSHLSDFKVEIGKKVLRGEMIGSVGNTGRSTGPHLHYEVRFNGIPQDPELFILD
ncbi:MAG: M23 family metallopeptidase [Myxococcota bacterium]